MFKKELTYSYNDVAIVPASVSTIKHRSDCNVYINNKLPIFTAPMSTVINEENFEIFNNVNVTMETKQKQIKFIQNLIGNINKNIAQNIDNKYIKHYMTQYGFVPLWVLVNILSFGDICNFYRLMKQKQRIEISMEFNIAELDLSSLLNILCKTRNLCAHGERLYNYNFQTNTSINDTKYHSLLNLSKTNN